MYNKGDTSFLSKPKYVPFDVVDKLPSMIRTESLRTGQDEFFLCFHGGEPLLTSKNYFVEILEYLEKNLIGIKMKYSLQTNATLVDMEWIEIFRRFNISISASIDGPFEVNKERNYISGKTSTNDTINGIRLLVDNYENFSGVIAVIQPFTNGKEVVNFFINNLKVKWFDLLLPDFHHDDIPENWKEMQHSFFQFYKDAFIAWYPHATKVSCRIFEVMTGTLLGYKSYVDSIGLDGVSSMIIETDGSIEPHDVVRMCDGFNRNTNLKVSPNAFEEFKKSDVYRTVKNLEKQFSEVCESCSEFSYCKGGNILHRYSKERQFLNPSVHCYTHYNLIRFLKDFFGQTLQKNKELITTE